MARTACRALGISPVVDGQGNKKVGVLFVSAQPVYIGLTGSPTIDPGDLKTDQDGELIGFLDPNVHSFIVSGKTYNFVLGGVMQSDIDAVVAGLPTDSDLSAIAVRVDTVEDDGGPAKLGSANTFTADQTIHGYIFSGRFDAGAETPDFKWDNGNFKLKTKGIHLADIGDTPDLGMRRQGPDNAAFNDAPVGLLNGETYGRLYFQGWGENGAFVDDYDTPTNGQHQAATVGARPTQDTGVITTTTASGTAIGATTVGLASVAGLPTAGGQVLIHADNGADMTVVYDSISAAVLQNTTGVTAVASTGATVTSFKRGGEIFFETCPNGTDLKRQVASLGQDGRFTLNSNGMEIMTGNITFRNGFVRASEVASPATPDVNEAFFFVRDNGSGKTQWVARFNTGADVVVATQA